VRLERAGARLAVTGGGLEGCAVVGEARLVGERLYVMADRLELGAEEVEAPAGADVVIAEQGARWRASRVVVRVSDGRVTLEGVSPVGDGGEQGVESAKEESER
jgi:threonine dehydrogenase-like Zn-dependent dehydrogenase